MQWDACGPGTVNKAVYTHSRQTRRLCFPCLTTLNKFPMTHSFLCMKRWSIWSVCLRSRPRGYEVQHSGDTHSLLLVMYEKPHLSFWLSLRSKGGCKCAPLLMAGMNYTWFSHGLGLADGTQIALCCTSYGLRRAGQKVLLFNANVSEGNQCANTDSHPDVWRCAASEDLCLALAPYIMNNNNEYPRHH